VLFNSFAFVERHFGVFAFYVMYFPQLVAGPIERPHTTSPSAAAFTSDGRTPPDAAASIASCAYVS
jgi:D-alanyl-lipoteichoic acid acyltransferase DltB (MBOAT superfamily)